MGRHKKAALEANRSLPQGGYQSFFDSVVAHVHSEDVRMWKWHKRQGACLPFDAARTVTRYGKWIVFVIGGSGRLERNCRFPVVLPPSDMAV